MFFTILTFLIVLSVLVLVHELGHFLVAKFFKIKVEEFGFGFPPRVISKKIGETLYSINLLPVGGFVKLYGEDEAGGGAVSVKNQKSSIRDVDRAFFSRPYYQKILIVVAGVFMNFMLAISLLSFVFGFRGVPVLGNNVIVSQTAKNSPAQKAGLKEGDIILTLNNKKIDSTQALINETRNNLGKKVVLTVDNKKTGVRRVEIVPRLNYPKTEGAMGVAISQNVEIKKYPLSRAPLEGLKESIKESRLIISGMVMIFKDLLTRGVVPAGVAGPVGIAQLTGQVAQSGLTALLSFTALLSLNLAILNILPIPALDGGRLFFILVEAITRRKVNPRIESYAHAVGIALLLGLIALITLHDLTRIFQGKPILPQ